MSDWQFRTLLLAMAAAAAVMAAEGVQTFAEMARRNAALSTRWAAISPVAYGTVLPALHTLAPVRGGDPRILLRADGDQAGTEALCALAAEGGSTPVITWIAFSAPAEPCAAHASGGAVRRGEALAAKEFGTARWMVLDANGAVRYSSRDVPTPERLQSIAALLAPPTRPESRP